MASEKPEQTKKRARTAAESAAAVAAAYSSQTAPLEDVREQEAEDDQTFWRKSRPRRRRLSELAIWREDWQKHVKHVVDMYAITTYSNDSQKQIDKLLEEEIKHLREESEALHQAWMNLMRWDDPFAVAGMETANKKQRTATAAETEPPPPPPPPSKTY